MTSTPLRLSVSPVAVPDAPDKRTVVFDPSHGTHLWVALCLGSAGAILVVALFLCTAEVLFATKWSLLEGLVTSAY